MTASGIAAKHGTLAQSTKNCGFSKVDGKLLVLLGYFQRFMICVKVATAGSENALNMSRLLFAASFFCERVVPRNGMTLLTGFTRICPVSTLFAGGLRFGLTTHHHSTSRLLA